MFWSLLEIAANSIFLLCVIMLLSRYGGLADVGRYGLAMAISAPIFMLTNMRLRFVYVTGYSECHNAFHSCLILRVISSSCALILILITAFVWAGDFTSVLIVVTLYKYVESLSDYIYSMFHRHAKMWIIARSSVLSALLSVSAIWIMLDLGFGIEAALFSSFVVKMNVLLFHDLRKARAFGGCWGINKVNAPWVVKAITNFAPLGLLAVFASISVNAPRLFLGWNNGLEAVGVYTGLSHLALGGALLVNALAYPYLRDLGESHEQGKHETKRNIILKLIYSCALVGLVLVLCVYFFGGQLLYVLYGHSFQDEWADLTIIMVAGSAYYQTLIINHVGTSIGLYKRIVLWQLASLVIICVGLYMLTPSYGILGAGLAWALGSLAQIILFLNAKKDVFA